MRDKILYLVGRYFTRIFDGVYEYGNIFDIRYTFSVDKFQLGSSKFVGDISMGQNYFFDSDLEMYEFILEILKDRIRDEKIRLIMD